MIVLTTHSMEEADLLCDDIHVMAEGRLAASGSPLSLKARYGVGYTLTVVLQTPQHSKRAQQVRPVQQQQQQGGPHLQHSVGGGSSSSMCSSASTGNLVQGQGRAAQAQAAADGLMQLVKQHVPSAQLLSAAGSEVAVRLPKEEAACFPAALRALDAASDQLGVSSYGLSVTTLEEVFLAIADQTVAVSPSASDSDSTQQQQQQQPQRAAVHTKGKWGSTGRGVSKQDSSSRLAAAGPGSAAVPGPIGASLAAAEEGLQPRSNGAEMLTGASLYWQQLKALFVKRAMCAR